jgi:flagellar L-ring protein FlgH
MKSIDRLTAITILFVCIVQFTQSVYADSLWTGTKITEGSYFVDTATGIRHINDIIFIYISESTEANVSTDQLFDTKDDVQSEFNDWFKVQGWESWTDIFKLESPQMQSVKSNPANLPGLQFNVKNKFDSQAESNRTNLVKTKLAARIIEIKPNGNLLLEAKRFIKINQEMSQLLLTGEARPTDIDQNNQIESTKLAELKVSVIGQGDLTQASRRGIIARVLDFLR